ncbi:MAG: tyrosine-type recombinase/integrase [Deltaproteobacteria bacterium]|jgi:integrase|nr:tyrosine-type recombinase/integrase [Deltaproteobacteria bacterium]
MALNEALIGALKPSDKPIRHTDGRGLYLEVYPNGAKYWKLGYYNKYKKYTTKSLGKHPDVSLKEARTEAAAFKSRENERQGDQVLFKERAEDWFKMQSGACSERNIKRYRYYLDVYILPKIGLFYLKDITPKFILNEILRPIEAKDLLETAKRVKGVVQRIFQYAATLSEIQTNPAAGLEGLLKTKKVKHRAAILDPKGIGRLLDDLSYYKGTPSVEFALMILPYVFVRPGELRRAEWGEIDFEAKLWRIPPEKMKLRSPHLVPLSDQVVKLLEGLKKYTGDGRFLFPGRAKDKPISDVTLIAALRYLGYSSDQMCPHGFRSLASTTLNELGYNYDWIERQLAHSERSGVRAAYNHADYLKERTRMMQDWADYLDKLCQDYLSSRKV